MSIIKDLLIKIINENEGCTIPQLIDVLYTKSDYVKKLLETTNFDEFLNKTAEEKIEELTVIINESIKNNEISCLTYTIPTDETTRSFLITKGSKIVAFNNKFINDKNKNNNISIGTSILYIFLIVGWIFGIALSTGWMKIVLSILVPPFAWVIWAEWIIELINKSVG